MKIILIYKVKNLMVDPEKINQNLPMDRKVIDNHKITYQRIQIKDRIGIR